MPVFSGMPARDSTPIHDLQRQIAALGPVFTGSLSRRTKICGKRTCVCRTDPEARHGPYLEWSRRENGRFVTTTVTPETAEVLARGILEHRKLDDLIAEWEQASMAALPPPSAETIAKSTRLRGQKARTAAVALPRPTRKGRTVSR